MAPMRAATRGVSVVRNFEGVKGISDSANVPVSVAGSWVRSAAAGIVLAEEGARCSVRPAPLTDEVVARVHPLKILDVIEQKVHVAAAVHEVAECFDEGGGVRAADGHVVDHGNDGERAVLDGGRVGDKRFADGPGCGLSDVRRKRGAHGKARKREKVVAGGAVDSVACTDDVVVLDLLAQIEVVVMAGDVKEADVRLV